MRCRELLIALAATAVALGGCRECGKHRPVPTPPPPTATVGGATPIPTIASPDNPMVIMFGDGDPDIGPAPLTVQFSISDPYMAFLNPEYHWDFGDGSPPSNQRSPVHVYEHPGKYTAQVVVKDRGEEDEDTVDIVVEEPAGSK